MYPRVNMFRGNEEFSPCVFVCQCFSSPDIKVILFFCTFYFYIIKLIHHMLINNYYNCYFQQYNNNITTQSIILNTQKFITYNITITIVIVHFSKSLSDSPNVFSMSSYYIFVKLAANKILSIQKMCQYFAINLQIVIAKTISSKCWPPL